MNCNQVAQKGVEQPLVFFTAHALQQPTALYVRITQHLTADKDLYHHRMVGWRGRELATACLLPEYWLHPLNTSCTLHARRESVATLLWWSRTGHNQTCTYMHRSTYVFSNTTGLQEVLAYKSLCQTCTYLLTMHYFNFISYICKSWTVAVILWSHIIFTKGVLNATCVSVRTYYSTCHKNFTKSVCTLNTMQSI